jgi:glyoxylase-like metal-dependent hydrolase (beta-lactamase superfamily II)
MSGLMRLTRALSAVVLLAVLSGCEFVIQPIGGADGKTQVYAAAGKGGAPNAGIVCTSLGCVVIDPPLSPSISEQLKAQAEARSRAFWDNLYSTRKERPPTQAPPVLYVLNTTFRASHSFGNQSFELADIISTPRARQKLEASGREMREELRDVWKVPGLEAHAITPATLLCDGTMTIDSPEVKIQFVSMGDCVGEGDAVVFLPVQRVLFTGDLVLPGYVPYYRGRTLTMGNWIAALKKLDGWDVETVVPGHGDVGRKDAIAQQLAFLELLMAETAAQFNAGKSEDDAAAAVKLPKFASWQHYNDWLGENVRLAYRELSAAKKSAGVQGVKDANGGAATGPTGGFSGPDSFSGK